MSAALFSVIASEAKQSRIPPRRQSGLLRRFAPRNDALKRLRNQRADSKQYTRPRILAARCARALLVSLPSFQKEGAGKTGCRPAPMASVLNWCAMMHRGNTGEAGNARPSLRSGLTAYGVLSPETNSFLSPSPRELAMHQIPVGSMHLRESLTVATTARTTRFCRTRRRRSSRAMPIAHDHLALRLPLAPTPPASTASLPAFVTTYDRPFSGWDRSHIRQFRILLKRILFLERA